MALIVDFDASADAPCNGRSVEMTNVLPPPPPVLPPGDVDFLELEHAFSANAPMAATATIFDRERVRTDVSFLVRRCTKGGAPGEWRSAPFLSAP